MVWRHRCLHRQDGVRAVKRSLHYTILEAAQLQRPKSPDPQDRTVSKRDWERRVQQWRFGLAVGCAALSRDAIMEVGAIRLVLVSGRKRTLRLSAKLRVPP